MSSPNLASVTMKRTIADNERLVRSVLPVLRRPSTRGQGCRSSNSSDQRFACVRPFLCEPCRAYFRLTEEQRSERWERSLSDAPGIQLERSESVESLSPQWPQCHLKTNYYIIQCLTKRPDRPSSSIIQQSAHRVALPRTTLTFARTHQLCFDNCHFHSIPLQLRSHDHQSST